MSKPRSAASARAVPQADRISVLRTGLALLATLLGAVYVVYYTFWVRDDGTPARLGDLGDWNWLIGFGLFFLGLVLFSHPGTPLGRGRGIVVGMLGSFLLGLLWIVVYYVTSADASVPLVRDLGNYNLVVGIGFMAVGFVYATKWE